MNTSRQVPASSLRRAVAVLFSVVLVGVLAGDAGAAGYPKINLAIGYEVDPNWPDKPSEITWRYVTGVAVDKKDRVWTFNALAPQVQVYDAAGKFLFSWGKGHFVMPHFIRIDHEENVWTADFRKHVIQKFSPDGKLLLTLGTPGKAGNDETHLNGPTDIAVSPTTGEVFVTDGYGNNRVMHYDATGKFIKSWGELGVEAGQLSQPHSIAMDSKGRLYIAERNNCRIQVFDQQGKSLAQWRNLVNPWGIWITPDDRIYVSGSSPKRWTKRGNLGNPPTDQLIMVFNTDGRALELWTFPLVQNEKQVPGHLDWAHGTAVDSKGNLYLSDVADNSKTHRVQKFIRLPAER